MIYFRLYFVLLAFFLILTDAQSQGVKLLEYIPEKSIKSANAERRLQWVKKQEHLVDTKVAKLSVAALNGEWISFDTPDGKNIQINRTSGIFKSSRDFSWIGTIRLGGGEAVFSVTDGILLGTIRLPLTAYRIEPLEEDLYLISRIVRELIPPPDPESGPAREPKSTSSAESKPKQIASTSMSDSLPVVRILVAYTPASVSYFGGNTANAIANESLLLLNQAFMNSHVNIQAELAGTTNVNYIETGNFPSDLANLRANPILNATRDALAADIVITLFSRLATGDNLCGLAYLKPSSEFAYGIVVAQWLNLPGDCFAHEVGHIFGADHNSSNASGNSFAYGHGYQYSNPVISPNTIGPIGCFRTIMAYDFSCPQGGLSTPNNFSNPSVSIPYINTNGVLLANRPSGNALYADNARVLNEQGPIVAAFRGSSSAPSSPGTPQAGAAIAVMINFIMTD